MPTRQLDQADLDLLTREIGGGPVPADYLLFVLRAARRRKRAAIVAFLAGLAACTAYFLLMPPRYRAETRILAQRQQSLPSIVRSSVGDDRPTLAASELIHRRDNLVELIRQAGLLAVPPEAPAAPAAPAAVEPVVPVCRAAVPALPTSAPASPSPSPFHSPFASADDPLEELVLLLDRRLKVEAGDVTIDIALDWPEPRQAYRIVEGALQNFLEARHVQEVTALDENIAILLGRAAVLRGELAEAAEELRRDSARDLARPAGAQPLAAPAPPVENEEAVRLRSMLDAKVRTIADVEEFRRRRLAELQAQYESRRSIYAWAHPEMVNLRLDIQALSGDSAQLAALRAEEKRLREQSGPPPAAPEGAEAAPRPVQEETATGAGAGRTERLREASARYRELMASVNQARLELDAARSAFKHRYKVIWPAQVPKKPVSPNPWKVFGAGGLGSLLLAILVAATLDWRSGRVLERWQLERGLGLPVLWEHSSR